MGVDTKKRAFNHVPLRRLKRILLVIDLLGLFICFNLAFFLRFQSLGSEFLLGTTTVALTFTLFSSLYVFGAFDIDVGKPSSHLLGRVFLALLTSALVVMVGVYLKSRAVQGVVGRGVFLGAFSLLFIWVSCWHLYARHWLKRRFQQVRWLVLSSAEDAQKFWEDCQGYGVDGQMHFLLGPEPVPQKVEGELSVLGGWDKLHEVLEEHWSGVVVTGEKISSDLVRHLMDARLRGQKVIDFSGFYERLWQKVPVYHLKNGWFVLSKGFSLLHNPINLRFKRLGDLVLSSVFLVLTSPLFLILSLLIRIDSPGAAIFKQKRVGKDGRIFTIFKFRSMGLEAEKDGAQWATENDRRVTRVGRWIRLTRLDELPQLWNVLKGDMSFIGPRPERPEFHQKLEEEIPFYGLRHLINPGITGWAQVNYSYGASVFDAKEKLQYELYYIKNHSLTLDLIIILKTIRVVIFGKGR